jgi:C4-type Zn-finger protein
MSCPRCQAGSERTEHVAKHGGKIAWTIYYCPRCSFTWRDCEPARTIDPNKREPWSQVHPDEPDRYVYNIPPAIDAQKNLIFIHDQAKAKDK